MSTSYRAGMNKEILNKSYMVLGIKNIGNKIEVIIETGKNKGHVIIIIINKAIYITARLTTNSSKTSTACFLCTGTP